MRHSGSHHNSKNLSLARRLFARISYLSFAMTNLQILTEYSKKEETRPQNFNPMKWGRPHELVI